MAGSYRKLKNGKWELCVSLGFNIKGKRIRKFKNVEAKNKSEVEVMLAEFVAECTKGNYSKLGNLKLSEFYDLWIKDYAESSLRKKTVNRYKALWTRIDTCLGHFILQDLKPTHLIEFYKMLKEDGVRLDGKPGGLSPKTIKHHHFLLSSIMESALQWELIVSNPCSKIKLAKLGYTDTESRKKIEESMYTLKEVKMLIKKLENVDIKYKLIIYLAIFTGCRREELMGIEWKDIDFETGEIKIQRSSQYTPVDGIYTDDLKTSKSKRECFVPVRVIELIKEYKLWWDNLRLENELIWIDTDRLFVQKNGSPMHPDSEPDWFRKFLKRSKLRHTRFHNLRHIHGSILLLMGMDMNSVADQMGHADLQMLVQRYGHNIKKKMHETADFMSKAIFDDE